MDYSQRKGKYAPLYESMVIKEKWKSPIYRTARKIVANRDKYEEVSKACGGNIPWEFIGIIHNRESGCDFSKHLHNGDSLLKKTWREPKGRPLKGKGPFTFLESAVDALKMKGFHEVTDWSIDHMGYMLEKYNGFGYAYRKKTNPYLWSGTQHYTRGKFIRDHAYSPTAIDQQMGVMPLLFAVKELATENTQIKDVIFRSRRLSFQERFQKFMEYVGIGGVFSFTFLTEVKNFVNDNAGWVILGVAATSYLAWCYINYRSKQEVKEGRYIPSVKKRS